MPCQCLGRLLDKDLNPAGLPGHLLHGFLDPVGGILYGLLGFPDCLIRLSFGKTSMAKRPFLVTAPPIRSRCPQTKDAQPLTGMNRFIEMLLKRDCPTCIWK